MLWKLKEGMMTSTVKRILVACLAMIALVLISLPFGGADPVMALMICGLVFATREWWSKDDEKAPD